MILGLNCTFCSSFNDCNSSNKYLVGENLKFKYKKKITSKYCIQTKRLSQKQDESKLQGLILGRKSGKGIVASIYLQDIGKGTLSDSTGYFEILTERRNYGRVEISSVGFDELVLKNINMTNVEIDLTVLLGTTIMR